MTYSIGCDHSAVDLKMHVKAHLESRGITVIDHGTFSSESTDYPLYAKKVAEDVQAKTADKGVLICGTGIGMSMAANKFDGIRAAAVSDVFSARASREHNNANVLCFGARVVGPGLATMMTDAFIDAEFQEGRHRTRVDLIQSYE